jgi:hypothetical protein
VSAARRLERALGRTGALGAGLLAACAAFWLGGVAPAESRAAALRAALAQSAARPAFAAGPVRGAEESLANFYGYFASQDDAFAALQDVFAAAAAEGLALDAGEYRIARERASPLMRYQIVFPVKGSYPKIRRFVARALNEVPGMALTDFALKRDSAQAATIEARVQLTLYLGGG